MTFPGRRTFHFQRVTIELGVNPVLIPVRLGDLIANKGSSAESLSLGSPASSGWGQSLNKTNEKDSEATRVALGGCFKQGSGGNMR